MLELVIDVRAGWAPLGSQRYLELIDNGLFTQLPFFRVCPKYITQFGVKYGGGKPVKYPPNIKDDPSLWGIRDMDFGYVFFAGSGLNSRSDQMVIALCETKGCRLSGLGKAPWEVPVGTIRKEHFETLSQIAKSGFPYPRLEMAGQHPKAGGPNQGQIVRDGTYLQKSYPFMEYFNYCRVEQRNVHIQRPLYIDHPELVITKPPVDVEYNSPPDTTSIVLEPVAPVVPEHTETKLSEPTNFLLWTLVTNNGEGQVVMELHPEWAPLGVDRIKYLVSNHFFNGNRFFRVISVSAI